MMIIDRGGLSGGGVLEVSDPSQDDMGGGSVPPPFGIQITINFMKRYLKWPEK